jgi:DNA replication and repair protein RecF
MLTNLHLRNFRCFEGVSIDFGPAFNLFLGANGEGKTTILEAACILLRLQSQRSFSLAPVIQIGQKFFEVRGRFEEHELEFRYSPLRRRVKFDEIEQRTLREYLRIARVVSLANADIELVRGGSEGRRRYLDFLGAQIDGSYRPALRAYERALRARNTLLKSPMLRAREVAAYDAPLIKHGRVLLRLRAELTEMLAPLAAQAYQRISTGRDKFALRFLPGASDDFGGDLGRSNSESNPFTSDNCRSTSRRSGIARRRLSGGAVCLGRAAANNCAGNENRASRGAKKIERREGAIAFD